MIRARASGPSADEARRGRGHSPRPRTRLRSGHARTVGTVRSGPVWRPALLLRRGAVSSSECRSPRARARDAQRSRTRYLRASERSALPRHAVRTLSMWPERAVQSSRSSATSSGPEGDERGLDSIPPALAAQARRAARNGVSVEKVLLRYNAGHAQFEDFVMQEAEQSELASHRMALRRCWGRWRSCLTIGHPRESTSTSASCSAWPTLLSCAAASACRGCSPVGVSTALSLAMSSMGGTSA